MRKLNRPPNKTEVEAMLHLVKRNIKHSVFGTKLPNLEFSENDTDLWEQYQADEQALRDLYARLLKQRRYKK